MTRDDRDHATGERIRPITRALAARPGLPTIAYAISASFAVYFCMYAFRKPFTAATYLDEDGNPLCLGSLELKTIFTLSQIVGYMLSKYIGVKLCPEVRRHRRALWLVGLVVSAELALLLFACLPGAELKALAIFFNGLPLGMVWGVVVRYLEGRRTSEILLAGLSCSFITASGVVKDVGRWLLRAHEVGDFWMPFVTGMIFLPPFILFVWLLDQLPDPDGEDEAERVERAPMTIAERVGFVARFLPGLTFLFVAYFFLTAYRDFRDVYGVEVFQSLGYSEQPALFSRAELLVAVGVLVPLALLVLIKDNRLGLAGASAIMITGIVLLGVSTLLLDAGIIDGFAWMTLIGLGSYLAYVPYGSVLFDRLIATTRVVGTAVFAIYLADALGYTGSVGVQIYRDVWQGDVSRFEFLRGFTYFLSVLGAVLLAASAVYFWRATRSAASGAPSSDDPRP